MRPSRGCNRLKAFRLYSLSSSTIRLASKRRIQVRVLLVDDDAAIARSIELMLKIEEINVYRTDLGEEGVDLGKIYDYDIILLDLNLPDISGYEVLRSPTFRESCYASLDPFWARKHRGQDKRVGPWR